MIFRALAVARHMAWPDAGSSLISITPCLIKFSAAGDFGIVAQSWDVRRSRIMRSLVVSLML